MNAPTWLKWTWAAAPLPIGKRIILSGRAAACFGLGVRSAIAEGVRRLHQIYVLEATAPEFDQNALPVESTDSPTLFDSPTRDLKDAILYPACIELEVLPGELNPELESHRKAVARWANYYTVRHRQISKLVNEIRPHAIVYFQGCIPDEAILRGVALDKDIPFLAVENSAFNQRVSWDTVSGLAVTKNLAKNFHWKMAARIDRAKADLFAEEYLAAFNKVKSLEHSTPGEAYRFPDGNCGLRILYVGQVFTDASIIFGLRGDLDPLSAMVQTTAFAKAGSHHLVIKLHPKENGGYSPLGNPYSNLTKRLLKDRHPELLTPEGGVSMLDDKNAFNTFELMKDADLVVTHSSQAGLEAAILGKPVVVCGEAFYRDMGFTFDAGSLQQLRRILEDFHRDSIKQDSMKEIARNFFYAYCNHYTVRKTPDSLFKLLKRFVH